ncbi:hypothetical protein [Nocardia spumae]|uniref:hypothetical protein n=1 Tax=Nocardia spumae TaxID=2887190 RepID=UPI001D158DE0|nr:hypothetical protein [Nocardia spumae]
MDPLKLDQNPTLDNSTSSRPPEPVTTPDAVMRVDPAAMATYTAIANSVSQQLASAATVTASAVDPQQLAADLGLVGADFAAKFAAAVSEHAEALSTAGKLVSAYGHTLTTYTAGVQGSDEDSAAAIARTEQRI